MNHLKALAYVLLLACSISLRSEVISLFLKAYPSAESAESEAKKIQRPGKIAHYTTHGILNRDTISGHFATFAGYLDISDLNGQIIFPRFSLEEPEIFILVTPNITPMIMAGNTIHHWELEKGTPAAMYVMKRTQDPVTDLYFWNTQQVELPRNNVISLETLLIFAKPHNIVIPSGITLSNSEPNLVLPDIYIKKGIKIYPSTLYLLNLKQFFGPIDRIRQAKDTSYSSHAFYPF